MAPASVFAVEVLLISGGISLLIAQDSIWGVVIGVSALTASAIIAVRSRVSWRSLFGSPSKDDLRKLYHTHKA